MQPAALKTPKTLPDMAWPGGQAFSEKNNVIAENFVLG